MRPAVCLLLIYIAVASVSAQRFDVVSIKPVEFSNESFFDGYVAGGGMCARPGVKVSANRVLVSISTVCGLIRAAYDVRDYQVIGTPDALTKAVATNFFSVDARIENGATATPDQARTMLQSMLADRFKLHVHREPRQVPIYTLVVAKGGHKLAEGTDVPCPFEYPNVSGPGVIASCKPTMSMAQLVFALNRQADRPIMDKTGLTGKYAFVLRWLAEASVPSQDPLPSLFTAIQEQLGLKLEPQRDAVDAIVVDHVESPSPN